MKLQVINHIDIESLEKGIVLAKPFDYIVMNEQTRLDIACHSNGHLVAYQKENGNGYMYRNYRIAICNFLLDGEVEFVKAV